jgi:hypothetical protein
MNFAGVFATTGPSGYGHSFAGVSVAEKKPGPVTWGVRMSRTELPSDKSRISMQTETHSCFAAIYR